VVQAAGGLVLFFVPAAANIAFFGFALPNFVPSVKLQYSAMALGVVGAVFFIWGIARVTVPQLRQALSAKQFKAVAGHAALIAFAPVFGFSLLLMFMAGPVSYALHLATETGISETEHEVLYADRLGHARCINRVILRGHGVLWRRQLCSVPDEMVEALSRGGAVVTQGYVSNFGEIVRSSRVVALPANRSFDTDAQQRSFASLRSSPPVAGQLRR
jgi:hypothetical protein